MTSFFPSLLGLPILISGIMAQKVPEKRKLWMHIVGELVEWRSLGWIIIKFFRIMILLLFYFIWRRARRINRLPMVVFGLLCAIGGTRFFMVMSKDDVSDYAKGSMLMLLVTGAIYTFLCVKSFRFARINATE